MKRNLKDVVVCPRNHLTLSLSFYGDDADAIRDLAEEYGMCYSDIVRRLTLMGLAELLDEGAPDPEVVV